MIAWRTLLATLALGAAIAVPAAASGVTIIATPNPVHAGHVVTIHGKVPGCPSPDEVTLISRAFAHTHDFAGLPALYAKLHAGGAYSIRTRIPASRHGRYVITGRCGGGNIGVARTLHVL